ncbi:MAG: hypothetical protein A3F72_05810 [Bacteroidetes bacterium RIFCSPLOWO2_12_FULL_35_15]|nr:MAG: hypothetical protein A3F72_05810 [Bacteroidetes bacterium RIFCSPLOWO2_12_FULL_35_15]
MKTLKLLIIGFVLFFVNTLQAQVSVNVNIGTPPLWGPVGYTEVRYYYIPDVEAYYDVESSMFIYYSGGAWIHRSYLPRMYRNYDLYGGYKVVMTDYHGNTPYSYFKEHKIKYAKGYQGQYQKTNGEKPGKGNTNSKGNSNKKAKQGNGKNVQPTKDKHGSPGNEKNIKKGNEHGGGNGKKK